MIKIKRKIWLPAVIWAALFLFVFNLANYFQEAIPALINASFETLTSCAVFYFTALVLFPRFYKSGRGYFWGSILFLTVITVTLVFIDENLIAQFRGQTESERPPIVFHYIRYFFSTGFAFFVATSLSLMEQTRELQASEKLLTEEKLATELKLLKAQINPHFIFNALNNIYSLTYMQSKNAPDSILKLSEMLRYVFYDCNKDRVPLSAEIKYIENFTGFQQMKSENKQNISLKTDVNEANIDIAPMLFIPFIENAFKYSRIEEIEDAFVNIEVNFNNGVLAFCIENSIPENKPASGSGMGINNVKHRLDIIYPGSCELHVEDKKDKFRVNLSLKVQI